MVRGFSRVLGFPLRAPWRLLSGFPSRGRLRDLAWRVGGLGTYLFYGLISTIVPTKLRFRVLVTE